MLTTYEIIPTHAEGSNISLQGCFDMPKRTGVTYHEWADDDSVDPFVGSDDIIFEGRDIVFTGFISGSRASVIPKLETFYTAIKAFTDLVVFSTPYGDFTGYVKSVTPKHYSNGTQIEMVFREPVVDFGDMFVPEDGTEIGTMYVMTYASLGLYPKEFKEATNLNELKEQFSTVYGSEGHQINKRKGNTIDFYATLIGASIADFILKVEALYGIFSMAGTEMININDEVEEYVFAAEGFKITNVIVTNSYVIANFNIRLLVTDALVSPEEADEHITADDTTVTADSTLITADNV
jgi:hypothetical protein